MSATEAFEYEKLKGKDQEMITEIDMDHPLLKAAMNDHGWK